MISIWNTIINKRGVRILIKRVKSKLYKITVLIVLSILSFVASVSLSGCREKKTYIYQAEDAVDDIEADIMMTEEHTEQSVCAVYVCGAVRSSGVYYLDSSCLKQDAVNAAGGMTAAAASDYVNLAEHITDGERIYIPYEEEIEGDNVDISGVEDADGRVNINTASRDELMTLSGIGGGKADAIIAYREENGNFLQIEDIMKVQGIKEATFNNIRDYIVVD